MISRPEPSAPSPRARLLRLALIGSVLVHLLIFAFVFDAAGLLAKLMHVAPRPPKNETVTMSTALRFEKRSVAQDVPPSTVRPPAPQSQPVPVSPPHPVTRPAPPVPHVVAHRPVPPSPRPHRTKPRELAKVVPRAAPIESPHPTAPPRSPAPVQTPAPPAPQTESERQAQLSRAMIARIDRDLAKSIAQDRSRENPLSNVAHHPHAAAAASRRAAINIAGIDRNPSGAQGLCTALRVWLAHGYVYFYLTCRTQRADGTVRNEAIPWPTRYLPSQVATGPSGPEPPPGEIPLPLPGWHLAPGQRIDPDVLDFLRQRGFRD